jgi:hypothetical protein
MKIQWLVRDRRARRIAAAHREAAVAEKQRVRRVSIVQAFLRAIDTQQVAAAQAAMHRQHALVLIQRAGRGHAVRGMMRPASAAFMIQRFSRRKLGDLKRYELAFCAPAQRIQCMVRTTQARSSRETAAARVAAQRKRRVMDGAARLIQQLPKIFAARRRLHNLVADAQERRAQQMAALRQLSRAMLARVGRGAAARASLRTKHTARNGLIASAQVWLRHLAAQRVVRRASGQRLLNAAAAISRAAAGHQCARAAIESRSAKESAVVESHARVSAAAASLGRAARGFQARFLLFVSRQEAHAAAAVVQRGVRTATSRVAAKRLRAARDERTRAQERDVAATVLQRWVAKRHRRRVAAVRAIQRTFRRFGQHRFNVRRENRAMYADVYACKQRSMQREEQRGRSAVVSEENAVFRDSLLKEATAILGHSHAFPMTRVAARANRRVLLRTLVLEAEDAVAAGSAMELEEVSARDALGAAEAVCRREIEATAATALRSARARSDDAACRAVVHAEAVARLRLARRHVMFLRHAIVEPFHAAVGATYAVMCATIEDEEEPVSRAAVADAYDEWVRVFAGPQASAIRDQALAWEERRRREAEAEAARAGAVAEAAEEKAASASDAALADRRTDSELARAMRERLARRSAQGLSAPSPPIVGRLRPFSKPTGRTAAGKRDLTAQDLRTLLTIPTPSERLLAGHTDRDDMADRAAIAQTPPALPPSSVVAAVPQRTPTRRYLPTGPPP